MEKEIKLKSQWPPFISKVQFGIDFVTHKELPSIVEDTDLKVAVITDSNVYKLYAKTFEYLNLSVFSFPAGESSKTRETKDSLENDLMSHNFGRDTLIIGFGGGVALDLAGFVASTYCRGVPLIQIPTSLLAMVDAAIGGKTGVNTPYGKNMIGTFYPPQKMLVDGIFLSTLSLKQRTNGVIEMLKAGIITSPSLFKAMQENVDKWHGNDLEFMMEMIYDCVKIKRDIVEDDPEEGGRRRCLNLGHTFGHALEILSNYAMEHGQAVAIGILVSCYISVHMGLLSNEEFKEIKDLLVAYQVPLEMMHKHTLDDLMRVLARDKKALRAYPRLVLLESIGKVDPFGGEYCTEVDFSLLEEAINWMNQEFYHG